MRGKVARLGDWEREMRSILDEFDGFLSQVNEIDEYNRVTIDKINREMCAENRHKFSTIIES